VVEEARCVIYVIVNVLEIIIPLSTTLERDEILMGLEDTDTTNIRRRPRQLAIHTFFLLIYMTAG
jgi:hypothetical protein